MDLSARLRQRGRAPTPQPRTGGPAAGSGGGGGDAGAGFANNVLFASRLKALREALEAGVAGDSDLLLAAVKEATSPLVNELLAPGPRAGERAWQLSQVAAGAYGL